MEWFISVNQCIKRTNYIGLTFKESPPNVDLCSEMEKTFKCIHDSFNGRKSNQDIFKQLKESVHPVFISFASKYQRMQRKCDLESISKEVDDNKSEKIEKDLHSFKNDSETTVLEANKTYYHQTIVRAEIEQPINWIEIGKSETFNGYPVKKDVDLSSNYLKASIVKLKFKFPYYGHFLEKLVVATGGFIYVGSLFNPLITKAQYIAPLMANFDPTLHDRAIIKYVDNTTHFICTWENLMLKDQPDNGFYTFQVVLDSTGTILFNYKKIPR
jgi:hypothetical protein